MISKHDILVGIIAFVFMAGSVLGTAHLCMWVQSVFVPVCRSDTRSYSYGMYRGRRGSIYK